MNTYKIKAVTIRAGLNRGRKTSKIVFTVKATHKDEQVEIGYNQVLHLVKAGKHVYVPQELNHAMNLIAPGIMRRRQNQEVA